MATNVASGMPSLIMHYETLNVHTASFRPLPCDSPLKKRPPTRTLSCQSQVRSGRGQTLRISGAICLANAQLTDNASSVTPEKVSKTEDLPPVEKLDGSYWGDHAVIVHAAMSNATMTASFELLSFYFLFFLPTISKCKPVIIGHGFFSCFYLSLYLVASTHGCLDAHMLTCDASEPG